MDKPSVAIDGPVASGKSTAAKAVAERLGFLYIDTGAMYRALALAALRRGVDPASEGDLLCVLDEVPIVVEPDTAAVLGYRLSIGGRDAGADLFSEEVSRSVSVVAAHPEVRRAMVAAQRALAERGPVVMAGRDIGTVVLPNAPFKVFLTASVDARVARRAAELEEKGSQIELATLRQLIEERDRLDSTRAVAPLRPAPGAVIIDSSSLDLQTVVARIVELVRSGQGEPVG